MSPRSGPASRPSKDTGRAPVGSFGSAAGAPVTSVRADVWLWAVRVYRTRALAQAACKGGHVTIDGGTAKASTPIRVGTEVRARTGGNWRTEKVLVATRLLTQRVGAPLAAQAYEDHSPPPPPPQERPLMPNLPVREPGTGRPTKRDRRELRRLRGY